VAGCEVHLQHAMEKDKEIDGSLPIITGDDLLVSLESSEVVQPVPQDGPPLMNWDRGLVGWDSLGDPANPL